MGGSANLGGLLLATVTGLAAIVLALAPVGLSAEAAIGPHFLLIVLAFWSARRPAAVPSPLVFALGALSDLTRDGPIGAELLALLLVTETLKEWSESRPPFGLLVEAARFALAALALDTIVWLLLAVTYAPTPPIWVMLERAGMSALVYPLMAIALERLLGVRRGEDRFSHLSR